MSEQRFESRAAWTEAVKRLYPTVWLREQDDRTGHKIHALVDFKLRGVFAVAHEHALQPDAAGQGYLDVP
jgi:hypothetical protein